MKRNAPAAERNCPPIADVLAEELPAGGRVLEVASGTGQHTAFLASRHPHLRWTPSDLDPDNLPSIRAWTVDAGLSNVDDPVLLDATASNWPITEADVIMCINMIHISPWRAAQGLLRGAGAILPAGGLLYLYGPYLVADHPTAPSNEAFDASLRARNGEWGLRWLHDVVAEAHQHDLELSRTVSMPANNLSVIFRRAR